MKTGTWLMAGVLLMGMVGLTGCEQLQGHEGAAVGAGAGTAVGATAGALIGGKDNRATGAVIGGVLGAAAGGVAGDQLYDKKKKEDVKK